MTKLENNVDQILHNGVACKQILQKEDPETREDFYALVEGIRMKASEILETKDK